MKDTAISYDLVHQQQQQHHHQHSWNQNRHQQHHQTHTTSVYTNHSTQQPNSQSRSALGALQQHQQHAAQLGQYQQHQQLQTAAHHNTAAAAAAYYQQALYPTYQTHAHSQEHQHQQAQTQTNSEHHHLAGPAVTAAGGTSPVVNAGVVGATQHATVHHPQAANTQASALNHTGWSPSVGAIAQQSHHAVVTDHSNLAYMTHAYQSHNSPVNDHHRNSNAPIPNQPIGTGPQASTYGVDALYNTAAAAAAAYGYNNYNAAFFQTSNNGPHTQTGHPSQAGISTFWNHNQNTQNRTNHSQAVPNQAPLQQRQQPISSDQAQNYMHDPQMYYGRSPYGQGIQNFGQHHSQAGVVHHRMPTLAPQQQHPLVQHHDQTIHQLAPPQGHQINQHPVIGVHQASSNQVTQTHTEQQQQTQRVDNHLTPSNHSVQNPQSRKIQTVRVSPQHQTQRQPSAEIDSEQAESNINYDQLTSANQNAQQSILSNHKMPQSQVPINKELDNTAPQINTPKDNIQQSQPGSISPVNKIQSVIKSESTGQYQSRKPNPTTLSSQIQGRNVSRAPQDERVRPQAVEPTKKANEREQRPIVSETKNQLASSATRSHPHQEPDNPPSLEESMASLSFNPRKTTWASIASQPAKVSQPKSLKSKIAGSNSVLSAASKHLTPMSMDSSSLESKNGINPAIKSSVSAAATSIQRSSVPPPISKISSATVASLKLDLLGEDCTESSKISWPAVNASINLTLDDPPLQKETSVSTSVTDTNRNDRHRIDDGYKNRDSSSKDHNHNQSINSKMVNNYPMQHGRRDERRDEFWQRREPRDHRVRRGSDRREPEHERKGEHFDDQADHMIPRREFKVAGRGNFVRGDETSYREQRDFKRAGMNDRNEIRGNGGNDTFHGSRFSQNRFEPQREQSQPKSNIDSRQNENMPNRHYNNVRDVNSARGTQAKPDLTLHPYLNPANFNPKNFDCDIENARYFIIKSYSEDDIHRSIKYSIWCSTNHGNKRLDEAFRMQQSKNGQLYLLFSVNGSGRFCGMAQMVSAVDFDSSAAVWAQSKWQGKFSVKWIYVKDVPNNALKHITLENNEDKPVTNSRDTQEVPSEKGKAVLKIIHQYNHSTSIFDDFLHYERRQEEEKLKKSHLDQAHPNRPDDRGNGGSGGARFSGRPFTAARLHNDFHGSKERPSRFA